MYRPITFSLICTLLCFSTANAASVLSNASLLVQNSVSINHVQAIDFGKITINRSSTYLHANNSKLMLSPQGDLTTSGTAFTPKQNIQYESAYTGSPALFNVNNSLPYIDLTLDVSHYSQLEHISGYEQNGKLHFSNLIASSTKDADIHYVSGDIITTDITGKIELAFGGVITIDNNKEYDEGLYTGTYSIALHY